MSLEAIFIPSDKSKAAKNLLVMLHGWGADANDLAPLAPMFNFSDYQFIFPHAPFTHPQVPGGRAWYALETQEYKGLRESRQILLNWLISLEKMTGVPLERTILAGFSQGGAMTLDVGLNLPLAGLCSLSGYLHSQPQALNKTFPPVLILHGRNDPIVPVQAAQKARDELINLGVKVQYHEFPMGHEIQPTELKLLNDFIQDK